MVGCSLKDSHGLNFQDIGGGIRKLTYAEEIF